MPAPPILDWPRGINGHPAGGGRGLPTAQCLCVPSGAGLRRSHSRPGAAAAHVKCRMSGPNGEPHLSLGRGEEEEEEEGGFGEAEYAAINSMLDQINSCLDHLEEKNDHLHARLKELLESNRQTRLEFQQQLSEDGEAGDSQRPELDT